MRRAAHGHRGHRILHARNRPRGLPLALDHGCEQLTFNPSLSAEPTTAQTPTRRPASTSTSRSRRSRARRRRRRRRSAGRRPRPARRASRSTRTPPTARSRCSDADTGDRHPARRDLPRVLEGRHAHARQLGAAGADPGRDLPRRPEAGRPLPAHPRGRRLRHAHQARRLGRPGSADRAGRRQLRRPAADPADRVQHALLRLRTRTARDARRSAAPTRSKANSSPGTTLLPAAALAQLLRPSTAGPAASPVRTGPRPFSPRCEAGSRRTRPRARHARSRSTDASRRRPEPQRARRHDARRASRRRCKGVPYCPEAALAAAGAAGYSGVGGARRAELPGREPDRHVDGRRRAPGPPGLPRRARSTSPGPYKGAPLSLVVVTPAVSGPYDLGNVVVRAAVNVDPVTAQVTRGLGSAAADPRRHPAAAAHDRRSTSTGPDFTLNPTNCDPFAVEHDAHRRRRGGGAARRPASRSPTAPACRTRPKLSLRLSGGVNRRGHPAIHAVLQAAARRSEHAERRPSRCRRASSSTTPTSARVCTRVQFAAHVLPGRVASRRRRR